MTVAEASVEVLHEGDGQSTQFPYNRRFDRPEDLTCTVYDLEGRPSTPSFTASGDPESGATITITSGAPPLGATVAIGRTTELSQKTNYTSGNFPSEAHELTADKFTLIDQEQAALLRRSVKVAPGQTGPELGAFTTEGAVVMYDEGRFVEGPTATEVAHAQAYAELAKAVALDGVTAFKDKSEFITALGLKQGDLTLYRGRYYFLLSEGTYPVNESTVIDLTGSGLQAVLDPRAPLTDRDEWFNDTRPAAWFSGTAFVTTAKEGFSYYIGTSPAPSDHVTTASGVTAEVVPGADGRRHVDAFGADNTGGTDATAQFNKAIAGGPTRAGPGTYSVANITMLTGMDVDFGSRHSATLEVNSNDAGAFAHTASSSIGNPEIRNVTVKAASGVTGARFIKQTDKNYYISYAVFEGIETWANLEVSYDAYFIFLTLRDYRDGYYGSVPAGETHQFIVSEPASYAQDRRTNFNLVENGSIQHWDHPSGAMEIAYGGGWRFKQFDAEQGTGRLGQFLGMKYGSVSFEDFHFEFIDAYDLFYVGGNAGANPQETYGIQLEKGYIRAQSENELFVNAESVDYIAASAFKDIVVEGSTGGSILTNANEVADISGITLLLGTGGEASGAKYVEFLSHISPKPQKGVEYRATGQSVLPAGPTDLAGLMTGDTSGTTPPNVRGAASVIDQSGQITRFTLGDSNTWVFYELPAALVAMLRGQDITCMAMGYFSAAATDDAVLKIWEDVSPAPNNQVVQGTSIDGAGGTTLATAYAHHIVGEAATSLAIGWTAGGNSDGSIFNQETLQLLRGRVRADFPAF